MDEPTTTDLLLIACELAVQVECRPQREDGTDAAIYASSGPTVARRIRAGAKFVASCNVEPLPPGLPARYCWDVTLQVGAARKTLYKVWLDPASAHLETVWRTRRVAQELRASLPHDQRKNRPWGKL